MSCRCEALGPLQSPAHQAHSRAEQALGRMRELSRNLRETGLSFRRRKEPNPEMEVMINRAREQFHELHDVARQYLPEPDVSHFFRHKSPEVRDIRHQRKEN